MKFDTQMTFSNSFVKKAFNQLFKLNQKKNKNFNVMFLPQQTLKSDNTTSHTVFVKKFIHHGLAQLEGWGD